MANKSIEVRINSLDDARSCVSQSSRILQAAKAHGCESIELFVDESIRNKVVPIISGSFGAFKTYYKKIAANNGNVFFELPHVKSLNVQIEDVAAPQTPKRKAGRPPKTTAEA